MSEEKEKGIDYSAILADLESKRSVLDAAIGSLRTAIAAGALGSANGVSYVNVAASVVSPSSTAGEIPVGAFLGRSIPDAAKLCLQIAKRQMTTREIAEGLKKGGIVSTGKTSFSAIVHAVLTRASKSGGGIVKFDKSHWGLAGWLPPGLRTTQGSPEAGRSRKKKSKRQRIVSAPVRVTPEPTKVTTADSGHHPAKLSERAIEFLKAHPSDAFTAKELSEHFGIHHKVISMTLARPVKSGLIRMFAPGTYTAAQH